MTNINRIWTALAAVCIVSFGILLYLGGEIYQKAPPIPESVQTQSGLELFSKHDIEQGQLVWRSMGGHQTGIHMGPW